MQSPEDLSLKTSSTALNSSVWNIAKGVISGALLTTIPLVAVSVLAGVGFMLVGGGMLAVGAGSAAASSAALFGAANLAISAAVGAMAGGGVMLAASIIKKETAESSERLSATFAKPLSRLGKFLGLAIPIAAGAALFTALAPTPPVAEQPVQPVAAVAQMPSFSPMFNASAGKKVNYTSAANTIKVLHTPISMN